jgi:hypothetical protein
VGIYWNKDVTADGPDGPDVKDGKHEPTREKKPKPLARPVPNVPKARTWTSPPSADEPAPHQDDQNAPGAHNSRPGKR